MTTLAFNGRNRSNGTLAFVGDTVDLSVKHDSSAMFMISGTFVGTVIIEVAIGTTYVTAVTLTAVGGALTNSFTAPTEGILKCPGIQSMRARMTAYTSGTANVVLISTEAVITP